MLADLLARYGYALVFLATAAEGDATLVTATFLAHRGYFSLSGVMLVTGLATISINQVYFWTARRHGHERLARLRAHPAYGRVVDRVVRFGLPLVVVSRFVYGFRIAIPAVCGATRMSPVRFAIGDVFGAAVWTLIVGSAGYAFGQVLSIVVDDLRRYEWWIALVLALGLGIVLARVDWRTVLSVRKREKGEGD